METSQVRAALPCFDTLSFRGGVYTGRTGFFYTHGRSASYFEEHVKAAFPGVKILESGEEWKPFRGGASVAQGSHWWVKFTLPETN